jgi:4-amino-4-deoxy-L-arabinose transferase-like glycosyltransferase
VQWLGDKEQNKGSLNQTNQRPTDIGAQMKTNIRALSLLGFIVSIATVLRFWEIGSRPGYEWDETVYANIGTHVAQHNMVAVKPQFGAALVTYLYHPPFYFLLLGGWFKVVGEGITQARVLAALMSLVVLVLVYGFIRRYLDGWWAFLPVILLATDGWMVYTNRISWIENTLMVFGVAAMWAYAIAVDSGKQTWFLVAGLLLGWTVIFKHVGFYLTVAVLINWLIVRKHHRLHLRLLGVVARVIVAYLVVVNFIYGHLFWSDYRVQIDRALGLHEARGTISNFHSVIHPLLAQYHIFYATIALTIVGLCLVIARVAVAVKQRSFTSLRENSLVLSWTLAAFICFGSINLKFPHYYIMVLIPLYLFLCSEIVRLNRKYKMSLLVISVLVVVLAANGITYVQRFVDHHDNALLATAQYMDRMPSSSIVLADETVGDIIKQPYCPLWQTPTCGQHASYIITYQSYTQQLPNVPELKRLIATSTLLVRFKGFKETITVYQINRFTISRVGLEKAHRALGKRKTGPGQS